MHLPKVQHLQAGRPAARAARAAQGLVAGQVTGYRSECFKILDNLIVSRGLKSFVEFC